MTTQEKINELESRQIVLSNEMASSDAHAAKCIKLGLNFGEAYPEELERYKASRDEYNANEVALSELYTALKKEAQADAADHHIEMMEGQAFDYANKTI